MADEVAHLKPCFTQDLAHVPFASSFNRIHRRVLGYCCFSISQFQGVRTSRCHLKVIVEQATQQTRLKSTLLNASSFNHFRHNWTVQQSTPPGALTAISPTCNSVCPRNFRSANVSSISCMHACGFIIAS